MIVLSVNAGSSSLKFQAYDMPEETVLISGNFDFNIGAYDYHFDVAEVRNIYQMIIYMLILLICFRGDIYE